MGLWCGHDDVLCVCKACFRVRWLLFRGSKTKNTGVVFALMDSYRPSRQRVQEHFGLWAVGGQKVLSQNLLNNGMPLHMIEHICPKDHTPQNKDRRPQCPQTPCLEGCLGLWAIKAQALLFCSTVARDLGSHCTRIEDESKMMWWQSRMRLQIEHLCAAVLHK
jgi:hypothetical protein